MAQSPERWGMRLSSWLDTAIRLICYVICDSLSGVFGATRNGRGICDAAIGGDVGRKTGRLGRPGTWGIARIGPRCAARRQPIEHAQRFRLFQSLFALCPPSAPRADWMQGAFWAQTEANQALAFSIGTYARGACARERQKRRRRSNQSAPARPRPAKRQETGAQRRRSPLT